MFSDAPSPLSMLQSGQILCEQYRLVERLGRSPGRQTWRALDLKSDLRSLESALPPSAEPTAEAVQADLLAADPWDSGEGASAGLGLAMHHAGPGDSPEPSGAAETVILKLLAFSDEIDWGQVKLFEREAAVLKGLNHPALPRYRDSFSLEDRLLWFGLVQDDIPGQSLDQLLAEGGTRLTEAQLRQWAEELLEILIYLHGQAPPILHRDIKPSNVIWGDDQRIYLIDLGAAQDYVAKTSLGSSFTVVGTYGYAPLEQFGGRSVPASDLYALGATLVHLLTGMAPADLPQENLRLQFEAEMSPGMSPHVSLGFRRWLHHLLEPDVQRRMPSARAALMALRQLPRLSAPVSAPVAGQSNGGEVATQFPRRQPGYDFNSDPSGADFGAAAAADSDAGPASGPDLGFGPWGRQSHLPMRQPGATVQGRREPLPQASSAFPVVASSSPRDGYAISRPQQSNASLALLAAPTPAAMAPAGARLRLKRSPDLLLVEMPGEELGYVFALLGVGFCIWALLTRSATLPFCLLFTLLGMFLATPQVLRFERRGGDIRFSLGKQLGGYLWRWGRGRASGSLRQVFHTVESPRSSGSQSGDGAANSLGDRLRDGRSPQTGTTDSAPWLSRDRLGRLESNHRTLVVQTHQRDIPISTSLSWQEGTWLVEQIYAWCDGQ